jgi:hypothetical protein
MKERSLARQTNRREMLKLSGLGVLIAPQVVDQALDGLLLMRRAHDANAIRHT